MAYPAMNHELTSDAWIYKCCLKLEPDANSLSQCSHLYGLSPE